MSTLTILGHLAVDSLDPGRTYYMPGWQIAYATQRPLYSFSAAEQTLVPVADLASGPPAIAEDRRTVTVTIRPGVRFSPPVDREVTADDVKYALERFFSASVDGPYTHYFEALQGAPADRGVVPSIAGIEAPDDRTLVFHLSRPVATVFAAALALPATAPVPREYARRFDDERPSSYERHVVSTGPYMVPADAGGEVTGYEPGRRLELIRNPSWAAETDYRPAPVDRVVFEGTDNSAAVADRVLRGEGLVLGENPPIDVARTVVGTDEALYEQVAAATVRYIPLNTTVPPFDDVNVRRAVLAGFDRVKLRDARGGAFVGPVASHFLPPGFPGHEGGGGGVDVLESPRGDMELAAEYMRRAGHPSGRYTGTEPIVLLSSTDGPARAQADAVGDELRKLGFRVDQVVVPNNDMYPEYCTVPGREVDGRRVAVYGSAPNWQPEIMHPSAMLEPLFASWAIRPRGNNNYAQLNDPDVDAAMRRAMELEGAAAASAWAEVDRAVTAAAPGVPFVWERTTHLKSRNVRGVMNRYTSLWDVTHTYLD